MEHQPWQGWHCTRVCVPTLAARALQNNGQAREGALRKIKITGLLQ